MPRGPNGGPRRTHQITAAYGWVFASPQSYTNRSDDQLAVARIMTCLLCTGSATDKGEFSKLRWYLRCLSSLSLSTSIRNRPGFITPRSQRRLGASAKPPDSREKNKERQREAWAWSWAWARKNRGFGCRVCTRQPCIQRAHGLHSLIPDKILDSQWPCGRRLCV